MKLRIRGDSLRLRLLRSELERLLSEGAVEETIHFPGGEALRYRLETHPAAASVSARLEAGLVSVALPQAAAQRWGASDQEGLAAELPLAGGVLRVLIEKDFPCNVSRPHEDDRDAFPRATPAGEC